MSRSLVKHNTYNKTLLPPSHFKRPVLTYNGQIDQILTKHKKQIHYYFEKLKITFYSILYVFYNDIIFFTFKNYIICVNLSQNLVNLTIQKLNRTLKMGWKKYNLDISLSRFSVKHNTNKNYSNYDKIRDYFKLCNKKIYYNIDKKLF